MLKIATILASLLFSSAALADDSSQPAPYPPGPAPQKAATSNPGSVSTDRLGNTLVAPQPSKDDAKKDEGDLKQDIDQDSDEK